MADIGFLDGARTLVSAFRRIARSPAYWPAVLVPALIATVLASGGVALVLTLARPAFDAALSDATAWAWLNRALVWMSVAGTLLMSLFVALLLTTPLSAPALERLVALTERDLGVSPRVALGFLREMWCGARAQAAPLLWLVPAWVVLFVMDLTVPVLAPLTAMLRAALAATGVAWALLDYPLTLRGVPIRSRLTLLRRAYRPILGFGAAFSLLFWLPCCGILFIGVGVVAATELRAALADSTPSPTS